MNEHEQNIADNQERDVKMKKLIRRLFAEAPRMEDAPHNQAPAVECQIVLKSGYSCIGALSTTPEGLLRFMAIARDPSDQKKVIAAEHFFDYEDLQTIIVPRAQTSERSALVMG